MNPEHIAIQFLLRLWPFPRGTGWIVKRFFEHVTFRDGIREVRTTDGFSISIMPNEHIGRYLYLTGEFERSTVEVLFHHAQPGDTLLDIGANVGYMSACFLAKIPEAKAIAVEPQPGVLDLLRRNLHQFGERAAIAPVALSNKNGSGFMKIDKVNRGASKLVEETVGQEITEVQTWTAERLIREFNPTKIDIIKIDVEGHEEQVLSALESTIDRFQPRLIMFEDHSGKAAPASSIGQIFDRLGYSVYGIKKKLTRLEFPRIIASSDCTFHDYIAVLRRVELD